MSRSFRMLKRAGAPLWALAIFVGSTLPSEDISIDTNILFPHVDKFVHFTMYLILQVLMMWQSYQQPKGLSQKKILFLVISYSIVLELIQKFFLVDRFFENYDIIANITGALVGIIFFNRIKS